MLKSPLLPHFTTTLFIVPFLTYSVSGSLPSEGHSHNFLFIVYGRVSLLFLEGHFPKDLNTNPNQAHLDQLISLKRHSRNVQTSVLRQKIGPPEPSLDTPGLWRDAHVGNIR